MQSGDPDGPPLFLRFMCRVVSAASLGFAGKRLAAACFSCCDPHTAERIPYIYNVSVPHRRKILSDEKRTHPKSASRSMG